MAVPYTFGAATSAIPLSQLDSNFNTAITIGNTAVQLGNTVTTLNNMTLANVTIASGNVTLTNVTVTTANVTTANITTAVILNDNVTNLTATSANITTANITTDNITTANITTANIGTDNITNGTVSGSLTLSGGTANGVTYLNGSKVVTSGSALTYSGTTLTAPTLNLTNALGTAYGGTGLTSFTANGVVYASSTSALATGSALTFDGSTLAVGVFGGTTGRVNITTASSASFQTGFYSTNGVDTDFQIRFKTSLTDIGLTTSTPLTFSIASAEQMRLTSTGLGIGTSSPDQKLVVQGPSGSAGMRITDGTYSSYIATISSSGNFGNGSAAGQLYLRGQSGIGFTGNGGSSTQLTLDSSGNLGLGVPPSAWGSGFKALQIRGAGLADNNFGDTYLTANAYYNGTNFIYYQSSEAPAMYTMVNGAHSWNTAAAGTAGNAITFTQAMTLDASGNLQLGVTSPLTTGVNRRDFSISGGSGGSIVSFGNGSTRTAYIYADNTDLSMSNDASGVMRFLLAGVEKVRIDSSGNLLVGQTSQSNTTIGASFSGAGASAGAGYLSSCVAASTSGFTNFNMYSTGAGAFRFYVDMGGTIHATSIVITAISDGRLKENVRDLDTGLLTVMSLKPRRYDWKDGKGLNKKNAAGFIAQEFENVFPDSVGLSKAGEDGIEYKNINYEELIPTLVKAIQEQQSLIESLTTRLAALEAK